VEEKSTGIREALFLQVWRYIAASQPLRGGLLIGVGFYGGVGEIGGNKILISSRDGSLFFDFGLNMRKKRVWHRLWT